MKRSSGKGTRKKLLKRPRTEVLKRIGTRIRSERMNLGLSLEAFAKKVGISKMTLHRIETGATSPSIINLTEISFHLKRPIEAFIMEGEPKVVLLKREQQTTIMDPESGIKLLAPRGLISERISVTAAELDRGTVIEPHRNRGFEWAYLFKGKAVVKVSGKGYSMGRGDAIFYDAHYLHSIEVKEKVQYVGLFLKDA